MPEDPTNPGGGQQTATPPQDPPNPNPNPTPPSDPAPAPADPPPTEITKPAPDPAAAPEPPKPTVDYQLILPEKSSLGKDALDKTVAYAKEKGLSKEEAQELLNMKSDAVHDYTENTLKGMGAKWKAESMADPEIGGEKFDENVAIAKRAFDKFGDESFKAALNESGFGNHPAFLKTFYRIGMALKDDKWVPAGGQSSGAPKSDADTIYGAEPEHRQ